MTIRPNNEKTEPVTLDRQIACVKREIARRERVYSRFVAAGRMTGEEADEEMAAMRAVLKTLEEALLARARPPMMSEEEIAMQEAQYPDADTFGL